MHTILPPKSCCQYGPVQTANPRSSTVAHQSVLNDWKGALVRVGQRGKVCFQTSRTRPSNCQLQTAIPQSRVCPAPLEQSLAPSFRACFFWASICPNNLVSPCPSGGPRLSPPARGEAWFPAGEADALHPARCPWLTLNRWPSPCASLPAKRALWGKYAPDRRQKETPASPCFDCTRFPGVALYYGSKKPADVTGISCCQVWSRYLWA